MYKTRIILLIIIGAGILFAGEGAGTVSYTHLDVYKRQPFSLSSNQTEMQSLR